MGIPGNETKNTAPRLFVFGLGFTGKGLAKLTLERGWQVAGTCRSPESSRKMFQYEGIQAFPFDPNRATALSAQAVDILHSSTHILSCVPPADGTNTDPVLATVGSELQNCASVLGVAKWVGYLSSTGVYGDWQGDWVDEESELRATQGKGYARILAEAAWKELWVDHKVPVHTFRLGGIYGPGRSALNAVALQPDMASGNQRRRAMQRFTSRCHVYDICQALMASMERPRPGAVYNVVDDDPASRAVVIAYAEQLITGRPAAETPEPSSTDAAMPRPHLEEKRATTFAFNFKTVDRPEIVQKQRPGHPPAPGCDCAVHKANAEREA
ncbi:hypothetical protein WJX75_001963 [Coccomyxa subellipsoidea]|uniref:NAD-dependent epimerase/dehydratase domain-containing protein n=1 Tax=Coccomyxa subellipsoidea TaxID=248742 RepID=A0ABR2YU39_9CHLO